VGQPFLINAFNKTPIAVLGLHLTLSYQAHIKTGVFLLTLIMVGWSLLHSELRFYWSTFIFKVGYKIN
jgi:hypothetical protein